MKNIIIFITIFLIGNSVQSQSKVLSYIKPEDAFIRSNNNKSFPFFGTKQELINSLGQPLQVKRILDADMLDYEMQESYIYDGLIIGMETRPDKVICIDFKISNQNYGVLYKNHFIKIGDSIESLMYVFPESYNYMLNENQRFLRIEFDEVNTTTPYYNAFIIIFDKYTKLITKINVSIN